ncbi:hypothetical protein IWZ00DRAFT_321210 [Phyllosticta capitalensis]
MPLPTSGDPPKGYLTVKAALKAPLRQQINVIAKVVDFMPAAQSRGTDMQMTWYACDMSVPSTEVHDALKVKWFFPANDPSDGTSGPPPMQPGIENVGDVMILRNVKMAYFRNDLLALSNRSSDCIIVPGDKIPDNHFNDAYASGTQKLPHKSTSDARPPSAEEQVYVITLHNAMKSSRGQQTTDVETNEDSRRIIHQAPSHAPAYVAPIVSSTGKFRLLKDCTQNNKFHDLVVEVRKIFQSSYDRCEIYVTDYTENPRFFSYDRQPEQNGREGDIFGHLDSTLDKNWSGPWGQHTMLVMLFEPHAAHSMRTVRQGDIVHLKNVRIKEDPKQSKLEGVMHQDRRFPNRSDVIKPNQPDARMVELENRKRKYWAQFQRPESEQGDGEQKKSKSKKRAEKRRAQKERLQARREQDAEKSDSDAPQGGCNLYVVTERTEASPTRLADIIDNAHYNYKTPRGVDFRLPFINAKFRTQVRVVDFHPPDLRDFSRSLSDPSYNNMPAGDTQSTTGGVHTGLTASPPRWEWAFYLLIEDATTQPQNGKENVRIPLLVADKDAEYLLKLDPTDLRRDGATLNALSNKLWALWGNLEEVKASKTADEAHQAMPFECLVKQYGVEVPWDGADTTGLGFHRMFRMFGTTIKE